MRLVASTLSASIAAAVLAAAPAAAEVAKQDERGFVTHETRVVKASPRDAWMALITPSKWWNKAHTWSGDSANLSITPQAGGCFCERIPEVETRAQVGLAGSVQHMVVVYAAPDKALRMRGSLGPLQSEAATGVLTIAFEKVEQGTAITFEYVVGGYMRYEVPTIAKAVDGVMTEQLDALAEYLGPVEMPKSAAKKAGSAKDEPPAQPVAGGADGKPEQKVEEPEVIDDAETSAEEAAKEPRITVDEAFGDISKDDDTPQPN